MAEDPRLTLLLSTAAATALVHTLIPDHWLPFVLIGRARGWTAARTAAVSGLSALVHAALSAALGLATLGLGLEAARLVGESLERAGGVLLVAFGLVYAAWSWRKGGHFHPGGALVHGREGGPACRADAGDVHDGHLHYHADEGLIERGERGAVSLALIVGLNPCVLILPIVVAVAGQGPWATGSVLGVYAAVTTALMVGLSVAGVAGLRRLPVPAGARHMEAASGLLIAATGVAFLLLE